ncbi:MAG: HAMP domain-containing sensor histidine kinase [Planctomycetota bacterium]
MKPRFGELDAVHRERLRVNLGWLLKLRWAAVAGQLLTVLVARVGLHVHLWLEPLLTIIGLTAATNLALAWWLRRRDHDLEYLARRGDLLVVSIMCLDFLLLTALLYFSGGPSNPFVIFYVVNIVLSALLVRAYWSWLLTALAVLCYGFLFLDHWPQPSFDLSVYEDRAAMHLGGLFAAFATAAFLLVYFYGRVTRELTRFETELARERQRQAHSEKLAAMATLAAGAAHELGSPLSTIAVVARELERGLEQRGAPAEQVEDARLVREEVNRCRRILDHMAHDAGESTGEALERLEVRALVEDSLDGLQGAGRVRVHHTGGSAGARLYVPRRALAQALRGLLKNALDASPADQKVDLSLFVEGGRLEVVVRDEGEGMSPEVLSQAENPFFTTKGPGRGMGLGLSLSRTIVERLGGTMDIESRHGVGTTVRVTLPLAA